MYKNTVRQINLDCRVCGCFVGEANCLCDGCMNDLQPSVSHQSINDEDGRKRNKPRRGKAGKDF